MQPTLLPRPFHREGWVYEEKYDGWRMLAYKDGDRVQLISQPGRDHTRRFPDLVAAIAALRPSMLILDGEVCIFDRQLVSRFEWLRHGKPVEVATPPMFMAFDCLQCGGA
jgi:bifunctional non-homologous end joining protein LigD